MLTGCENIGRDQISPKRRKGEGVTSYLYKGIDLHVNSYVCIYIYIYMFMYVHTKMYVYVYINIK